MDGFSNLLLRASETLGAPAYLAQALGCAPVEVYRWIAGIDQPGLAERQALAMRLRGALAQRAAMQPGRRRWRDRDSERS
jgi:hypothetical protein